MNRPRKILFTVISLFFLGWCLIWVAQARSDEYITYTDPKTGVRYYGDALPPSAPTNVRIEVKKHEGVPSVGNNWTAAEQTKAAQLRASAPSPAHTVATPKEIVSAEQFDTLQVSRNNRLWDEMWHNSNKPSMPSRDRVAREFNRGTGAWEQYNAQMFNWQARGREMRQQYGGSGGGIGFGFYPGAYHE